MKGETIRAINIDRRVLERRVLLPLPAMCTCCSPAKMRSHVGINVLLVPGKMSSSHIKFLSAFSHTSLHSVDHFFFNSLIISPLRPGCLVIIIILVLVFSFLPVIVFLHLLLLHPSLPLLPFVSFSPFPKASLTWPRALITFHPRRHHPRLATAPS